MTQQLERCENCDRVIGKLETPMIFKGNVVCAECHGKLNLGALQQSEAQIDEEMRRDMARAPLSAQELRREELDRLGPRFPNYRSAQKPRDAAAFHKFGGILTTIAGAALTAVGSTQPFIGDQLNRMTIAAGLIALLGGLLWYAAYRVIYRG